VSMKFFLSVIGTVMVVEGIPYFISPASMKVYFKKISEMSDENLRVLGFVSMTAGLVIVYLSSG